MNGHKETLASAEMPSAQDDARARNALRMREKAALAAVAEPRGGPEEGLRFSLESRPSPFSTRASFYHSWEHFRREEARPGRLYHVIRALTTIYTCT